MIHEMHFELSNPNFMKSLRIPKEAVDLIHLAQSSITNLPQAKQLSKSTRAIIKQASIEHWDSHLSTLSVQNKFSESVLLEQECQVWKRIMEGLPAGQLSFILCAASDTLPTPLKSLTMENSMWCQVPLMWEHLANNCTHS